MNQYLYKRLPYDPISDFVPISIVAKTMLLLMVNASSDITTLADLLARQKSEPGKFNYGAGTITTQLSGYLLNKAAGTTAQLVRYNGSAQVTQGLLTNSVQYTIDGTSAAFPLIQDGKFRVLAKFDRRPFPRCPTCRWLRTRPACRTSRRSRSGSGSWRQGARRKESLTSCSAKFHRF